MTATPDTPAFRDTARCAEVDPELFFPTKGGSPRPAKRICAACESQAQCLEWALDHHEEFGIWGGTSPAERRLRRRRHRVAPKPAAGGESSTGQAA